MASSFGRAKTYEVHGLDDRLKIIAKQIDESHKDPWAYTFASELVSGTRMGARPTQNDGSEWEEINAVYWWFANNIKYNPDTVNYDVFRSLKQTVMHRTGDCFTLDTHVVVRSKATGCYELRTLGELEDIWPAFDALSYDFESRDWVFKPIVAWHDRGVKEVVEAHLDNGPRFRCTPDHQFWWYDGQAQYKKLNRREIVSGVEEHRTDHRRVVVAKKIPALGVIDLSESDAYLSGIYSAEGYFSSNKLCIAQDKPDITNKIRSALDHCGVEYRYFDRGGNNFCIIYRRGVTDHTYIDRFLSQGTNSFNMGFGKEIFGASEQAVRVAYEAHCDGDGWRPKPDSRWVNKYKAIHSTSSNTMIRELQLMSMILGEGWHTDLQLNHQGSGHNPIYRFQRYPESSRVVNRHVKEYAGLGYSNLRSIEPAGEERVCCITVADTHNFVLSNGAVVKNCDCLTTSIDATMAVLGYRVGAKAISKDGSNWHIYPLVAVPRDSDNKNGYVAMDVTQPGSRPGWEPDRSYQKYAYYITWLPDGKYEKEAA